MNPRLFRPLAAVLLGSGLLMSLAPGCQQTTVGERRYDPAENWSIATPGPYPRTLSERRPGPPVYPGNLDWQQTGSQIGSTPQWPVVRQYAGD